MGTKKEKNLEVGRVFRERTLKKRGYRCLNTRTKIRSNEHIVQDAKKNGDKISFTFPILSLGEFGFIVTVATALGVALKKTEKNQKTVY